jgi:hypothetical protein
LQTRDLGIWFHPYEGSPYSGTVAISSNDTTQYPFTVQLQGTGIDTVYPLGTPLWSYRITGLSDNSPKGIRFLQDITGDSVCDVLISSEDNFIRCFNGNSSGEADVMWATNIYSGNIYSQNGLTTMDDINNDGIRDVVIATTGGDRSVRALSGKTGEPIWQYDTHVFGEGGWVYQVDARFDYNGDGKPDVLACAGDDGNNTGPRRVFCLNGLTGLPVWICPTGGAVFVVTGVDDINGDGKHDVVAGATNGSQDQARVYGINGANGTILWTDTPASTAAWALLQIDDVTGDGIRDVASGNFTGTVYFHNAVTGSRVKSTVIGSGDIILRLEDMGDVDGDSHPDILVAHSGPVAVMISGIDATHIWHKTLSDQSWNVANMGDITWDGINDAGIGTLYSNNRTYFLDGASGDILEDVGAEDAVDAVGAIPDIVGDNSMELVSGDREGLVTCYSGGFDTTQTAVPGNKDKQPLWASIYPNPCNSVLHLAVNLNHPSDVSLNLTTVSGRTVYSCSYPAQPTGKQIFTIAPGHLHNTPPGLYILEVRTGNETQHLKAVFQ